MQIREIESLLTQKAISTEIKTKVLKKVKELKSEEKDVEVVVSTKSVTVDSYDALGMERILKIKID